MSSIETNVGSPPIVSRTSSAARSSSTWWPSAVDRVPLLVGVRLRDARIFVDPRDRHLEVEIGRPRAVGGAGDRRGADRLGRAGQRDVAFAAEQAGGRVEPDPAGAGQKHFGPGVQVGEVVSAPDGPSSDFTSALS